MVVLIWISLMTEDAEHFLKCFFCHFYPFLCKIFFQILAHIFIGSFVFLNFALPHSITTLQQLLCILHTNLLSVVCVANISFQCGSAIFSFCEIWWSILSYHIWINNPLWVGFYVSFGSFSWCKHHSFQLPGFPFPLKCVSSFSKVNWPSLGLFLDSIVSLIYLSVLKTTVLIIAVLKSILKSNSVKSSNFSFFFPPKILGYSRYIGFPCEFEN